MTNDDISLVNIVSVLTPEQKAVFDNSGLHKVVETFGTKEDNVTVLKTELGNLVIAENLRHIIPVKINMDLRHPVLMLGAFRWRIFDDGIEIHI